MTVDGDRRPGWTFLTNHAHVLICIAIDSTMRGRDIAARVGITERAVQGIIADLAEGGYITRTRDGRRNRYELHPELPMRHPLEEGCSIEVLLEALGRLEPSNRASASA